MITNEHLPPDSGSYVRVDPYRCRIWTLNARIANDVTEASCQAEIESFARGGQFVPVIGRALRGTPDFDIEVISGARRVLVARHLRIPLRVELRELTDRQATVVVEAENSLHRNISAYERGVWLAKLLEQNIYGSQHEMARELGITPTQVTRLLKFAQLPGTVIDAFSSPHDILESWAVELHKAWEDERRTLLIERAHLLEKRAPRPPAVSIYEILMASRSQSARRKRAAAPAMRNNTGKPLLRVVRQRNDLVLKIPNALVDTNMEEAVTRTVMALLTQRALDKRTASAA